MAEIYPTIRTSIKILGWMMLILLSNAGNLPERGPDKAPLHNILLKTANPQVNFIYCFVKLRKDLYGGMVPNLGLNKRHVI